MTSIDQLQRERDLACAMFERLASLMEPAAERFTHRTVSGGTIIAPHEGWQRALHGARAELCGLDTAAALDQWIEDKFAQIRGVA